MKKGLLLLFLISPCFAEGPRFRHKEPSAQLEFETVYQDLRKLSSKKQNVIRIDVTDYGAVPNDTVDDFESISSALTAARQKRRGIYIPGGTYLVSSSFTLTYDNILGDKGSTTIRRSNAGKAIFVVTGSATIQGLICDGNSLSGDVVISSGSQGAWYLDNEFINTGGTDYAFHFWDGDNEWIKFLDNTFRSNYGHLWNETLYYSRILGTRMYDNTDGYAINYSSTNINHGITDVWFTDTYIEGSGNGIFKRGVSAIRDVLYDGLRVRIKKNMTQPWLQSYYAAAGGEVASVTYRNVSLQCDMAISSIPLVHMNSYQNTMENWRVRNAGAPHGWSFMKESGTSGLRMKNIVTESSNWWQFFSTDSTGGFHTYAENINYTQGVRGQAAWGNPDVTEDRSSNHIRVVQSNIDHTIATSTAKAGGFKFEHISGNLDLTQSTGTNSAFDVTIGTVSDPNNTLIGSTIVALSTAVTIGVNATFQNISTMSVPAGNWSISGFADFVINTATWDRCTVAISSISAPSSGVTTGKDRVNAQWASSSTTPLDVPITVPPLSFTVTGNESPVLYYLKTFCNFSAGNPIVRGSFRAVRLP